jgi:predicted alpha/beta-hydrolase family hydrolase
VQGLVFVGFPLHPANKREIKRAEHLERVQLPMLFLQGTRDALADLTLLEPVIEKLEGRTTLHVVNDADHSFKVLKRSGRTDGSVLEELAEMIASWGRARLVRPGPAAPIP